MNPMGNSDQDGGAEVEDGEQEQYAAYAHACMRYISPHSVHVTLVNQNPADIGIQVLSAGFPSLSHIGLCQQGLRMYEDSST